MTLPENMRILHERDYVPQPGYADARYFRLYHDLKNIPEADAPGVEVRCVGERDYETVLEIIRASYPGIRVDRTWLGALTRTPVYAPELWLMATVDTVPVGCILADFDPQVREGILEWVQVLPQYRRRGIGKALVCAVLSRMNADFATVSGKAGNEAAPEVLYRGCGFTGDDVWHILTKE